MAAAALLAGLAGCIRPMETAANGATVEQRAERRRERQRQGGPAVGVSVSEGRIVVDDPNGERVMVADSRSVDGLVSQRGGMQSPLEMADAASTLYKDGKPETHLRGPIVTWDGETLIAPESAQGERVDGVTRFQGARAEWERATRQIDLQQGRVEQMKNGKLVFSAQAPAASILGDVVTMPQGAVGRNEANSQVRSNATTTWNLRTGVLHATGGVRLTSPRAVMTGRELHSNTRLQKVRVTGGGQGTIQKQAPRQVAQAPAPRAEGSFGSVMYRADTYEYDGNTRLVEVQGNARVKDSDGVEITADKITVQFRPNDALEWARAEGNVKMSRGTAGAADYRVVTGDTGYYHDVRQVADVTGNARAEIASERLKQPAVLTGSKIDADLGKEVYVAHKTGSAPARAHMEPKGSASRPNPAPIDLTGGQLTLYGITMELVATESPRLLSGPDDLRGDLLRFTIDEATSDISVAHATGNVIYDGQTEIGRRYHATADRAQFRRNPERIVNLWDNVVWQDFAPGSDTPSVAQFSAYQNNLDTNKSSGASAIGTRVTGGPAPAAPAGPANSK